MTTTFNDLKAELEALIKDDNYLDPMDITIWKVIEIGDWDDDVTHFTDIIQHKPSGVIISITLKAHTEGDCLVYDPPFIEQIHLT